MLTQQSFATGGWGPDELLREPGSGALCASLSENHASFETPCGAYAHFKITRYLLRVTRDSRYGDSMERVMYNTVSAPSHSSPTARPSTIPITPSMAACTHPPHRWPCCSGTLPQVAADYHISTDFRDEQGIYVNLYIPSKARFTLGNAQIELTQSGTYPFLGVVQFQLKTSPPAGFRISLRIPAWAEDASISVNGNARYRAPPRERSLEFIGNGRLEMLSSLNCPVRPVSKP